MMPRWFWLILVLPALLCAQPLRGPRPWWDSAVARDLNLTEAQNNQIRATVQEFRGRMSELRDAVNISEKAVEAAFNEDPVDQRKANDAIDRLANARGELTKAVSQMDLKLRMILTAQQWQELQERQRSRPPGFRRRNPEAGSATPNLKRLP
jgi:Spy/CpxP family protein refolding chaperone